MVNPARGVSESGGHGYKLKRVMAGGDTLPKKTGSGKCYCGARAYLAFTAAYKSYNARKNSLDGVTPAMAEPKTPSVAPCTPTLTLVDARGLSCPMPLLKAKLALNKCVVGESIRVLATDGGSVRDFHSFAQLSAHQLLQFIEHPTHYEYVLQKGV